MLLDLCDEVRATFVKQQSNVFMDLSHWDDSREDDIVRLKDMLWQVRNASVRLCTLLHEQ